MKPFTALFGTLLLVACATLLGAVIKHAGRPVYSAPEALHADLTRQCLRWELESRETLRHGDPTAAEALANCAATLRFILNQHQP